MRSFLDEFSLVKSWDKYEVDFTHSSVLNDVTHISTVDHMFWNEGLDEFIIDAGVLHILVQSPCRYSAVLSCHSSRGG